MEIRTVAEHVFENNQLFHTIKSGDEELMEKVIYPKSGASIITEMIIEKKLNFSPRFHCCAIPKREKKPTIVDKNKRR